MMSDVENNSTIKKKRLDCGYLHYIKRGDGDAYAIDWYIDSKGDFYTFNRLLEICFIMEADGTKRVRPVHMTKLVVQNWIKENGLIRLIEGVPGYGQFGGMANIGTCLEMILSD